MFGRSGSRRTQCDNDINLAFHQFNSEFAEPIGIRFSKLALNSNVLSFRVTKLAQPYQQRVEGHAACVRTLRAAGREDAYSRYPCSLLRWGGERPHGNQTSDSGDEITALHGGPRFQDKVLFQVNLAQTYKTSLPSRTGHKYVGLRPLGVAAGLVERAKRRGAHRRKRERKPCEGMMLQKDGSQHRWLTGQAPLDLIVTMDDATSTIYSAFLVEEEGTASTFCGLLEVFVAHGLPCSLYTDRGSHYFYTDKAGEAVDKDRLTQVGRALDRLGVEHIPAYSPEARGRSERMFATLQDRLVKELEHAGLRDIATANRWIPRGLSGAAQCPFRQACGGRREGLRGRRSRASARDAVVREKDSDRGTAPYG